LVLDAGTGIRPLGNALVRSGNIKSFDILLSHGHIDHVIGLPFFAPLFLEDRRVRVWGGNFEAVGGVEEAVRKLMSFPFFPLQVDALHATLEFHDFNPGEVITPQAGITVQTAPLQHPGGATGFRIECGGRAVTYLTDVEMSNGTIDPALLALSKNSGLVIMDATYTDEELSARLGWGHSSWQQAVRLADAANAAKLCLFHHDPDHDDTFMDRIAEAVAKERPGTIVASEGLQVDL
jgi:phosphoribosyl 1,2-cyclic phosphodiesterase